jgi:hypothetical protein
MLTKQSLKGLGAGAAALAIAAGLSCSTGRPQQAAFTSVGRAPPESPAIPWQTWRNA